MDIAQAALLSRWSARRFEALAFGLALTLRLAWLAVFQLQGLGAVYGRDLYFNLSQSWLGWAPAPSFDATHPPLYTAAIAVVLWLFRSPNPLPVLLLQCLLGAGSVLLVRRIGVRLMDEPAARLAALWVAVDPALIFFTPHLQTETLFVAMELLFFVLLLREWGRPLSGWLALVGLWGGLCALCRSVFGAFPAFLLLAAWRTRGLSGGLAFCALLGLGWLLPTGLWTARNHLRYGRLVPLSAQMGHTLYEGFTLDREELRRRPFEMRAEAAAQGITGSIEFGQYFLDKTVRMFREHPSEAAKIVLGKAFLYWRPWPYDPHARWQRAALGVYYFALFAFALLGARVALRADRPWPPIWALFAYLTVAHSVFFTALRYRLPLQPFLCLLAALGAFSLLRRSRAA